MAKQWWSARQDWFYPQQYRFFFYNKRFLKTRAVLAYPKEQLEACNLPGLKYPSDHFAHMAVLEEVDLELDHLGNPVGIAEDLEQAQFEEVYQLIKRDYVIQDSKSGGKMPKWFGKTGMPVEFGAVVKTLGKIRRVVCPDCNAKREQ